MMKDLFVAALKQAALESKKRQGNPNFPFYNIFYNQCQYEEDFILSDEGITPDFYSHAYDEKIVSKIRQDLEDGLVVETEGSPIAQYKGEFYISGSGRKYSTLDHAVFSMWSWWGSVTCCYEEW